MRRSKRNRPTCALPEDNPFSPAPESAMTVRRGHPSHITTRSKEIPTMKFRLAVLAITAAVLSACTTASVSSNPLAARWNGKEAGVFFAAYGPPVSDTASVGGGAIYTWRGGFSRGRSCSVELTVNKDYRITSIRALSDQVDPKGGPSHCEKVLDAA